MSNHQQQHEAAILGKILGLAGQHGGDPLSALLQVLDVGEGDRKIYNPTVEREGDKLVIPDGAHLPDVIATLQRKHSYEEQVTAIHVTIPVSPWDGALALVHSIESELGAVIQNEGFGGAHQIDVEVELGKTIAVPWGSFELPGMKGATVETGTAVREGRVVFECHVNCKRRYEPRVRRLLDAVRERATKESLHRGKAFSIAFNDEDGDPIPMPSPKFFEIKGDEPIFRDELTDAIERNVFVPIRHAKDMAAMGESLKRGILFAGKYGVGKTLLASYIARVATAAGWTFIYVKDSEELPEALRYAQQYQPVVVFAEDIDRVAGVERTDEVNELLNQLDGIDSKSSQIMTIVTTNHIELINEAMCRPGRIDKVVAVLPPDAPTVVRMIRAFAGSQLALRADLSEVSEILAGETPARVRESISRAKLEALRRTGDPRAKVNGSDLAAVAHEVKSEVALFKRPEPVAAVHGAHALAEGFGAAATAIRRGMNGAAHPASAHA